MNFSTSGIANATATDSTGKEMDAKSILNSILEAQRMIASQPPVGVVMQPDRNGNVYPDPVGMFGGLSIVVSDMLPKEKLITHLRERKWCHRKRFQKERRFNITYETVPNNDVYLMPGQMVVNQEQFNKIRDGAPVSFSMGMAVDPKADPFPYEPERPSLFNNRGYDIDFSVNPRQVALIRGGV